MRPGKTTYIDIVFETEPLEQGAQTSQVIIEGLEKAIKGLASQMDELVKKTDLTPLATQTVNLTRHIEKCDGQLLYLRMNMGRLKHAIADAAAPLGAVLLPAVNRAVREMTELANQVGLVLGALVDVTAGTDSAAQSAENAAGAQQKYTNSVKSARRSLADFDQIQRLNAPTGSTSTLDTTQLQAQTEALTPQLQAVVDKILQLLEPLQNIDFSPLRQALESLAESWRKVWEQIGGVLEWLWFEVLTPFVTWTVEDLAPVIGETLAQALELLAAALEPVLEGLRALWEAIQPIVDFIGQQVILALEDWGRTFGELAGVFQEKGPAIEGIFQNIGRVISLVWEQVEPILELLGTAFRETFGHLSAAATTAFGFLLDGLSGIIGFLTGVFTGDWELAWGGLEQFLRATVNGVIGLLNAMLSGITGALNGVIRAANGLRFTVPSWVPELGGQTFGLNLKTVTAPRIPYLAQGAVLPANRPFLAVVGDQRHGTNVEAPLSTIQQAVVQATAGQNSAMLAAMQASVEVQREILSAVLGIHIGDDMLAQAVDRYNRKMAVVYGTGRF